MRQTILTLFLNSIIALMMHADSALQVRNKSQSKEDRWHIASSTIPETSRNRSDLSGGRAPVLKGIVSEPSLPNHSEKLVCVRTSLFHNLRIVAVLHHDLLQHQFGSILWLEAPRDKFLHAFHKLVVVTGRHALRMLRAIVIFK